MGFQCVLENLPSLILLDYLNLILEIMKRFYLIISLESVFHFAKFLISQIQDLVLLLLAKDAI